MALSVAAMFVASAVAIFQDNLKRMFAYSSFGQIGYITSQAEKSIADLSTILDHYKTVEAGVSDGKRVFARWCSTQGKSGKPYSAVNTGWLGWWLDEIAPRPEKQELSVIERVFGVGGIK